MSSKKIYEHEKFYDEDEESDDDIFTLDDEKFNSKFQHILQKQKKIQLWVEPVEDKLKLFIKNGSSSKKMVMIIESEQFKQLQALGTNSTVEKILKIIPDLNPDIAGELNAGIIQNVKE